MIRTTHSSFAPHSPYFARHFVYVNQGSLVLTERTLPNSGNAVGPGGRGYPFLSMRLRINRRIVSTITIMSKARATGWVGEVDHSMGVVGIDNIIQPQDRWALYCPVLYLSTNSGPRGEQGVIGRMGCQNRYFHHPPRCGRPVVDLLTLAKTEVGVSRSIWKLLP